jgi:hypothetical protein
VGVPSHDRTLPNLDRTSPKDSARGTPPLNGSRVLAYVPPRAA